MIREETKEQREKIKEKPLKYRIKYFFDYYKFWLLGAMAFLILFTLFVRDWIDNNKVPSIYIAVVNAAYEYDADTSFIDDFVESRTIDTEEHPVRIESNLTLSSESADTVSLANSQRLTALFSTGDLDVVITDESVASSYAEAAAFANLAEILPADLFSKIEDKLFYHTYETDGKIPIGFYADDIDSIKSLYPETVSPIITISNTTTRQEISVDFINYLLNE